MIRKVLQSARSLALVSLVAASGTLAHAASKAVPQITQAVDTAQRVTLKGNVHPLLRKAQDLGALPSSTPADRMLLVLKRPPAQEAELKQFLNDVHTPGTPSYHKWLTPSQFGEQFGPADSDIQATIAWLQSQGFNVAHVSAGKTTIEFSGNTGQVQSAFHTAIHQYSVHGERHVANTTDPQIPAALAPVVAGISALNDFHPRPMHTPPVAKTAQRTPGSSARPEVTVPNSDGTNGYYVGPGDAATIYDTPNSSLNTHYAASQSLDGTGVTIAVAGVSNINTSDVDHYRTTFGLPANTPQVIVDGNDPGVVSGADVEALLDSEVSGALAPAAKVRLYIAADTTLQAGLNLAIQRALDENAATILNVSFGLCELSFGTTGNQQVLNFWEQAAAQGISVTVSTGDSGSAACDDQNTETSAQYGAQVNGLASTPYNIAVGGTDFNLNTSNEAQYWNTANASGYESAKSYIPEIPWNDSTSNIGPLSGNLPFTDPTTNQTNIVGAGGGSSGCIAPEFDPNTGNFLACGPADQAGLTGYAKPGWQQGIGGTDTTRDIPDISLFASDGFHNATWFTCLSGTDSTGAFTDCVPDSKGAFGFHGVGGTSAAAPAMAGILALVNQKYGPQGQADFTLYPVAAQHPSVFHDVTTGNNSVVCTAGSLDCGANGFLTGYDTSAGFDLATGLGSMDVTQLVNNWSAITFKGTTTTLSVAPTSFQHGKAVTLTGNVASTSGGTPTGVVGFITNAQPATNIGLGSIPLVNGTATSNSIDSLPGGTYQMYAQYSGDGVYGGSKSAPQTLTVTPEASNINLGVFTFDQNGNPVAIAPGGSVPYGTYVSADITPTGVNAPANQADGFATGTATFQDGSSAPVTLNLNSSGTAEYLPGYFATGQHAISATYSGDLSFNASKGGPAAFTIAKAPTALTATASTTPPLGSAGYTVTVTPTPLSGAASPTGAITVTDGATAIGAATAVTAAQDPSTGASLAQATVTIDLTTVPAGAQTLTLTYSGDGNYNGSTGTVNVTGTGGGGGGSTPTYTLAPTAATLTIANSSATTNTAQTTLNITPANGFSGGVGLTCTVTGPAGAQAAPTCALAASSVTINSAAATDTLTITATPPTSAALHSPFNELERRWYAGGGVALGCVLLLGIPGRRRALERAGWLRLFGVLLLMVAGGALGCGGGGSGGSGGGGGGGNPGTTAGAYTVTVTGTSGAIVKTATVTVNVQ